MEYHQLLNLIKKSVQNDGYIIKLLLLFLVSTFWVQIEYFVNFIRYPYQ